MKTMLTSYTKSTVEYILRDKTENELCKALLPVSKERAHIVITGPQSVSVTNAIRRCIIGEIPSFVLSADIEDIVTTEDFTSDWLQNRLALIPINQEMAENAECSVNITNTTADTIIITTRDLEFRNKTKIDLCEDTYQVAFLSPGKELAVTIKTDRRYPYAANGGQSVATILYYFPSDDEQQVDLVYRTNGGMSADAVLIAACSEIIERFERLSVFVNGTTESDFYTLSSNGSQHELIVYGESHTMGNLLVQFIHEVDPSIEFVAYRLTHETERNFILQWTHDGAVLKIACDTIIDVFKKIHATVNHS